MRRLRVTAPRLAAVTALAALSVAGCGLSSASTSAVIAGAPSGTPITVGISLPLTGQFSADGIASLQGYQLWASDVNAHGGLLGRPVKLVKLDDKSDPNTTAKDYNVLINDDHVDLTLAPFSTLLTISALPVVGKAGYALPAGSAGGTLVYQNQYSNHLFSTNVPVEYQMRPFADWVKGLTNGKRPKSAAYAMVDDPFADPPVQTTQTELAAAGISTVYSHTITAYANENKLLAAIKASADALAQTHADMVVLGTVDVPSVAAFINEFAQKGFTPKILIAAAGPDQGQAFIGAVGASNSVGVMVPNGWYGGFPNALSHEMVQEYIARYGHTAADINADVAEAFSAGEVLQAAVEATNGTDNAAIVSYLHKKTTTVQTVLGPVRFDAHGQNQLIGQSAYIFQWQHNEQFVQVLPKGNPVPWRG